MMSKIRILFFVILAGLLSATIAHAEGGGLRINYNKFNLYLEFNDNVPEEGDKVTGMEYIREPSGILYDLISLIQANKDIIAKSDQEIYINTDNLNRSIWLMQDKPVSMWVLKLYNLKHFDSEMLLNNICKTLKIKNCQPPETTYLYVSDIPLKSKNSDLIEFGCFPCSNKQNYTLTDRFTPTKPDAKKPNFSKVAITRKTINRYFQKLVW